MIVDQEIDPLLMLEEWTRTQSTPLTLIGRIAEPDSAEQTGKLLDAANGKVIEGQAFQHFG